MGRTKTFHKQRISLRNTRRVKRELELKDNVPVIECSSTEKLLDDSLIGQAIWECLKNNDPQGVVEIIETHLEVVNKSKAAQATDLPSATMCHAFKGKNPIIRTVAKMVHCCI